MALAEVFHGYGDEVEVGERRWADWWALPSHDVVLGGALLDVFEGWDGDDSAVSLGVHARFVALDGRLMAYEDWCEGQGVEPARRPRPDATAPVRLRLVESDGQADGEPVICGDCSGSGVVADEDGALSGQVGMLVECVCAEPARPVVVEACQTALGRPLTADERSVVLVAEYVTRCRVLDIDPDWCFSCGAHRSPARRRTPCGCQGADEPPPGGHGRGWGWRPTVPPPPEGRRGGVAAVVVNGGGGRVPGAVAPHGAPLAVAGDGAGAVPGGP